MRALAVLLVFVSSLVAWRDARACGVAYPANTFVRLAGEKTVIVWDAEKKLEHFVRKPAFDGDAASFGFFMPTPVTPTVTKESDDIIEDVAALMPMGNLDAVPAGGAPGATAAAAPPVEVLQRVRIDDFEIVTLKASSGDALGEWLKKNGFVDRPNVRTWAQRYLAKNWVISAMRYAPKDNVAGKRSTLATPTLRFTFTAEKPFYPYTEPSPDVKDEATFAAKYRRPGEPARIPVRPLDVWFVSTQAVRPTQGGFLDGPPVRVSAVVEASKLRSALGDTKAWAFDPSTRKDWIITHMHEEVETRVAFDDLDFPAEAGTAALPPAREMPPPAREHKRGPSKRTIVLALLALLIAAAAASAAWAAQRE